MSLTPLRSDALTPLRHGFFTRQGGCSQGLYDSLNCGYGSEDAPEAVRENRALVAEALGVAEDHLVTLHQTHSNIALSLDAPPPEPLEGDALVTAVPGLAVAALAADCQPVLFADHAAGVVAAAHAGWKGALGGILEATVEAMEQLGAQRDKICATIGPSISQRAYEVGPEFFDTFRDDDPEATRFFANGEGDRLLFNLQGYSLARLRAMGLAEADWLSHCTYSDPGRFFSYRRSCHASEPDYGRLISAIRL